MSRTDYFGTVWAPPLVTTDDDPPHHPRDPLGHRITASGWYHYFDQVNVSGAALRPAGALLKKVRLEPAPAPPLPVFTPTPTNWAPNFAIPHNLQQNQVIQQQADAVTANIDQSEDDFAPRAQALTQNDFHAVWRQLFNTDDGMKNHSRSGINNISLGLANVYANGIRGSGVCA